MDHEYEMSLLAISVKIDRTIGGSGTVSSVKIMLSCHDLWRNEVPLPSIERYVVTYCRTSRGKACWADRLYVDCGWCLRIFKHLEIAAFQAVPAARITLCGNHASRKNAH